MPPRNSRRCNNLMNRAIVERVLTVGGTCTGERHWVWENRLLEEEQREATHLIWWVKQALDPAVILNHRKVVRL